MSWKSDDGYEDTRPTRAAKKLESALRLLAIPREGDGPGQAQFRERHPGDLRRVMESADREIREAIEILGGTGPGYAALSPEALVAISAAMSVVARCRLCGDWVRDGSAICGRVRCGGDGRGTPRDGKGRKLEK
jgi:hypothetical protein